VKESKKPAIRGETSKKQADFDPNYPHGLSHLIDDLMPGADLGGLAAKRRKWRQIPNRFNAAWRPQARRGMKGAKVAELIHHDNTTARSKPLIVVPSW
jgi:hypothetical protein